MQSNWQTALSPTQDLNPRHAGPEFSGMIVSVIYPYQLLQTLLWSNSLDNYACWQKSSITESLIQNLVQAFYGRKESQL